MNETKIQTKISDGEVRKNPQEQFKSTKKWNEIIDSFCGNMPLKRHWRNFRTYTDCFTASEAIDWVYRYLKSSSNFQHLNISRQNAIKLLQIFLKERIIEDVRAGENFTFKEFQDDDRIYRFCTSNLNYLNRFSNISSSSTLSSMQTSSSSAASSNGANNKNAETNDSSGLIERSTQQSEINNENLIDKKEKKMNISMSQSNFNNVLNEKQLNNQLIVTKSDLENLAHLSIENISKLKSSNQTSLKNLHEIANNNQFKTSKENSSEMKRSLVSKSRLNEFEIWSKITRKALESILRKAVLNNSIGKTNSSSKLGNLIDSNDDEMENHTSRNNNKNSKTGEVNVSPKSSSTLKRSNDIKIGLSKLLDKKSHDILLNILGSNIEHNCNNINKHGVVINTNDDLPIWIVRAMHTLLYWESDNDEEYPKFYDVYQEIVDYFNALDEPLLTNDISYLFMQILNLLLVKSNRFPRKNGKKIFTHQSNNQQENNMNFQNDNLKDRLNCTDSIDEIINSLINQLNSLSNNENKKITNLCSTQKLLDIIANASNEIKNVPSSNLDNENDLFEQIEAKLIENAKLPLIPLEDEDSDDVQQSIFDELYEFIDPNNFLNNEQRETLRHNLLLASFARLESCCDECLNTYNHMNEMINKKSVELDEFLMYLNNEELTQEYLANEFNNSDQICNEPEIISEFDPNTQQEQYYVKSQYLCEQINHMNEFSNEYEDDDLIDIDDYDEFTNSANIKNFSLKNQKESFLENEMASTSMLITGTNINMSYNQTTDNSLIKPVNKLLTKSLSDKRLHRNNSFRAAIGDFPNRLCKKTIPETENLTKVTPKKPLIVRSSTNNSSDFNFSRSKLNKTEILYDPSNNDIAFVAYPPKIRSSSKPPTLDVKNEFNFKLPSLPINKSKSNISKSISMNFKSETEGSNLRKQKYGNSNKMYSLSNIEESRKRKASLASSSTESISSLASANNLIHKQPSKLNRNDSISNMSTKNLLINDHSSFCSVNTMRSTSTTNICKDTANRIMPSMSLSSLDHINNNLNMNVSLSLRNLSNNLSQTKLLSNLSLNELSLFIRTSLNNNQFHSKSTNLKNQESIADENNKKILSLSSEIDSDLFYHIISAFRLLALMLPPSNKRKLHFLLRFLNKLKHSKQSAKYLITNQSNLMDEINDVSYLNQLKDLNFIDSSYATSNSLLMNNTNEGQSNNPMFCSSVISNDAKTTKNKQKRRSSFNKELEDFEMKSNAIESIMIKSFLNSIVKIENENFDNNDLKEQLGSKLVQILINNYSEIMRIPDDLLTNVKQRLNSTNHKTNPEKLTAQKNGFCSKISLQEYDKQKAESKQYLANLLDNIVKDLNMNEDEKLIRLKKFKEMHPHVYQENQKIKKALNILGLNDSISYLNLNQRQQQHAETDVLKRKVFLTSLTDSTKKANLFGSVNNNSTKSASSSSSSANSSSLNHTTISAYSGGSKNSSMFQASTSINFPKFFLNKKWKKENLI